MLEIFVIYHGFWHGNIHGYESGLESTGHHSLESGEICNFRIASGSVVFSWLHHSCDMFPSISLITVRLEIYACYLLLERLTLGCFFVKFQFVIRIGDLLSFMIM